MLIMLGVSELFAFAPLIELFVVGGAGLITYMLVVIPASQVGKLIARVRHLRQLEARA
jgi:hypothetical protein